MKISNLRRIANFLVCETESSSLKKQTIYFPISNISIIQQSDYVTLRSNDSLAFHSFTDQNERYNFMFELQELITQSEKQQTVRWDMPNPDLLTELK